MKKTIYTLGMIGVISGAAYAADNYTCATPPSCASLGYTLTSTADCIGTPLKCPFDTSKYFCTTKTEALNKLQADIVTAAMPDYKTTYSRSNGTTYTAATNGFLMGMDFHEGSKGCSVDIWINSSMVRVEGMQTDWSRNSWSYPVKKGSTYRVISNGCWMTYYFVATI